MSKLPVESFATLLVSRRSQSTDPLQYEAPRFANRADYRGDSVVGLHNLPVWRALA